MIVNVSQCASAFDETFHALKFSAIARKVKISGSSSTSQARRSTSASLPKVESLACEVGSSFNRIDR